MKFDSSKHNQQNQEEDPKQTLRDQLWAQPSIIAQLFSDDDWQRFNQNDEKDFPSDEMFEQVQAAIYQQKLADERKQLGKAYRLKLWKYGSVAAASLLIIISCGVWTWKVATSKNEIVALRPSTPTSVNQDMAWTVMENPGKKIKTFKLPDQSTVGLFAKSSIRYPKSFSKEAREIYLSGKAYFSVQKDASRPFSVYAGGTKTTALGTSFTIDTRNRMHQTAIRLHTGKIVVAPSFKTAHFDKVFLSHAGESLAFDARSNKIAITKPTTPKTPKAAKPSQTKLLNMDNIPLTAVFEALASAYHVKIKIGNSSISDILYTGSIDVESESLNDALAVICLINDLRYEIAEDGTYIIYTTIKL